MASGRKSYNLDQSQLTLMKELYDRKLFCDLKIKVQDEVFSVHKAILYFNSPFFKTIITMWAADDGNTIITLKDINVIGFKLVLDYIYSSEINITCNNVYNILPVVDRFHIDDLRDRCFSILSDMVSTSSCVDIFKTACKYGADHLQSAAKSWIIENMPDLQPVKISILSCFELKCFTVAPLKNATTCKKQERVVDFILTWIKHDPPSRKEYAVDILKTLDFDSMSSCSLKRFLSDDIIKECSLITGKISAALVKKVEYKGEIITEFPSFDELKRFPLNKEFFSENELLVYGASWRFSIKRVQGYQNIIVKAYCKYDDIIPEKRGSTRITLGLDLKKSNHAVSMSFSGKSCSFKMSIRTLKGGGAKLYYSTANEGHRISPGSKLIFQINIAPWHS